VITQPTLKIGAGQCGIFGYGSLLSRESMELTLGHSYPGISPSCRFVNWRRSWDVVMPNTTFYEPGDTNDFVPENIIYLNVRQCPACSVNGLLYVVNEDELAAFDRREWIYDRTNVTATIRDVTVQGGEVYAYVAKKEWVISPGQSRRWAALRQSYLDIISNGLLNLGREFAEQYEASTDPIPWDLVFRDKKGAGSHPLQAEVRSHSDR
jgi:hypothetical protein